MSSAIFCLERGVRTYHIADAGCIDVEAGTLEHQEVVGKVRTTTRDWMVDTRVIGITAGASTPNNKIGETIVRICQVAGVDLDQALAEK